MTLTDFLQPLDLDTHIRMAEADVDLIYFGPAGDLPLPVMQQYDVIECHNCVHRTTCCKSATSHCTQRSLQRGHRKAGC